MDNVKIKTRIQGQVKRIEQTEAQLADAAAEAQSEIKIRLLEQMIELDKSRIAASTGEEKLAHQISKLEHMIELDSYKVEAHKKKGRRELVATVTSLRIQHEIELAKLKGNNKRADELERSMSLQAAPNKNSTEVLLESFNEPPFAKDEAVSERSIRTFITAHKLPPIPINTTYYDAVYETPRRNIESYIVVDNLSHHYFDFLQHHISEMFFNQIGFKDTEDGNIAIYDFLVDRPMLWLANTLKKRKFSSNRNKAEALSSEHDVRSDYLLEDEWFRVCMIGEEKKQGTRENEDDLLKQAVQDLETKSYKFLKSTTTKEALPFVFAYAAAGRLFQLFVYCVDDKGNKRLVDLTNSIYLDNIEARFLLITKIIGISRVIVEMCQRFPYSETRQLSELIPTEQEIRRKHMTDLCKLLGTRIRNTPRARLTEAGVIEVLAERDFQPIREFKDINDFKAAITSMQEALADMHEAGFVHGHIDWNDVVREEETGRYLLVNFDKACRVDEHHKPSDDLVSFSKMVLKNPVEEGEEGEEGEGEEGGDDDEESKKSPMPPKDKKRKIDEESALSAANTQEEQKEEE